MALDPKSTLYCSFCGKSQHEVKRLIAGPTVFICNECVGLCVSIIREAGFDIMPLDYTTEESERLLAVKVPSIVDLMLVSGFDEDELPNMTGARVLQAIAYGLLQMTKPEGVAKARRLRIAMLKREMRKIAQPARTAMAPFREQVKQLIKEEREIPP